MGPGLSDPAVILISLLNGLCNRARHEASECATKDATTQTKSERNLFLLCLSNHMVYPCHGGGMARQKYFCPRRENGIQAGAELCQAKP